MAETRNMSASIADELASRQGVESQTTPLLDDEPSGEISVASTPTPVAETPRHAHHGRRMPILFFLCGLGASLPYIAILSSLAHFSSEYGAASFVYLNLAAYLPLLPISIIQARYDRLYDEHYGSRNSFLFRGVVGYSICIGAMVAVPLRIGLIWVCAQTFLMGTAGAVLQGLLFQMSAFVRSATDLGEAEGLKSAVFSGIQGSALLALVVSVLVGLGSSVRNSREYFEIFCLVVSLVEVITLLLFLGLMMQSRVKTSMMRRDSSFIVACHDEETTPSIVGGPTSETGSGIQQISTNGKELSYWQLSSYTYYICASLFLTLVPSFLVGSWFTMVKSRDAMLPQILFYVRIGSDFVARLFAGYKPPSSVGKLLFILVCRMFLVIAFFINASLESFRYRDLLSVALVTNIAFGSGYLVTGCYQLAPFQLPDATREKHATKQAALLNLAFSFSAVFGVLSSVGLTYVS